MNAATRSSGLKWLINEFDSLILLEDEDASPFLSMELNMKLACFAIASLLFVGAATYGQELSDQQKGPWTALNEQVGFGLNKQWDKQKEYVHPKAILWEEPMPAAVTLDAYDYFCKLQDAYPDVAAWHLVPVNVVVVDDVAIINCYLHLFSKVEKGEQPEEIVWLLHNTWKREEGRWLLLSVRNKQVVPSDKDDD